MTSLADSITSAASAGSAASAASIYFPEALVGSVYYSASSGETLAFAVSEITAEGREWVITSAAFVGDKVLLTVEASGTAVKYGAEASGEAVHSGAEASKEITSFTFEAAASAFTASASAAEEVVELMFNGVRTAVKAAPIIAGSTGVILGCTLTLVSAPGVIIGVILTEAGRELHASS